MLTIENLSFNRDSRIIFKNLAFSLSNASTLIVTGRNGCGKSSLLKIIAGIYEASRGKILWGGEDIQNFRDDFNADLQYIGHKNFLKPQLTTYQNLQYYTQIHDTEMALNSALEYFEISQYRDCLVKDLSAGWQQKILLAKLLACPATIWLLDEPSNNLDNNNKKLLHNLIKNRIKDRGLIIMTTHDEMFFDLGPRLNLEDFS